MKIQEVFKGVELTSNKDWDKIKDIKVKDIGYSSKECSDGYIFVAIKGETTDGHKYVMDAYERGAKVFVINDDIVLPDDSIKIFVDDSRDTLSKISANFFGHPSKELTIIGVTGTKGKTTTCNYIKDVIEWSGSDTGIIGTNGIFYKDIEIETINTTPESYELQRILRDMVNRGIEYVTIEVSSGGLMMKRVQDVNIDIAVFTNISPDHIGPKEHPNFEHYLETKSSLFKSVEYSVINIDDNYGKYIIENSNSDIVTVSIKNPSDFQAVDIELPKTIEALGSKFTCKTKNGDYDFELRVPGNFNIYNALSAIAVAELLDIDVEITKKSLKNTKIKGRAEVLPILDYASVIIDFAHNRVSLQNILSTLREYNPNRLICLIGSVGGRSQIRRKEIGDVIAAECDISILTSDDPDFEDPNKIIDEIAMSFKDSDSILIKESDRKRAIEKGIEILEEGDIFLISGKGHDRSNLVNGVREYFSDEEVAIEAAEKLLKEDRTQVS